MLTTTFIAISVALPDDGGFQLFDGSEFTIAANGDVMRGTVVLGSAQKIMQIGNHILALGRTKPVWWEYSGSWNLWTGLNPDAILALALA